MRTDKPISSEELELHRDRCAELRDIIEDVVLVFGSDAKELLAAVDAYERQPELLDELAGLRNEINALRKQLELHAPATSSAPAASSSQN